MTNSTPFRIAINGYGRIGQCVLRALYENGYRDHLQVVAINELSDIDTIAHLTSTTLPMGGFTVRWRWMAITWWSTAIASGCCATRTRVICPGVCWTWTWCWNAPAPTPTAPQRRNTSRRAPNACCSPSQANPMWTEPWCSRSEE